MEDFYNNIEQIVNTLPILQKGQAYVFYYDMDKVPLDVVSDAAKVLNDCLGPDQNVIFLPTGISYSGTATEEKAIEMVRRIYEYE